VQLFLAAFAGGRSRQAHWGIEEHRRKVQTYFDQVGQSEALVNASVLVTDEHTQHRAAACIMLETNNIASVSFIGVHPDYRRRGLAGAMLRHAANALHGEYPLIRLGVAVGNPAQGLYHSVGFMPGPVQYSVRIPAGTWR